MIRAKRNNVTTGNLQKSDVCGRITKIYKLFLFICIFFLSPGCLTPNVRYTRPSYQRIQREKAAKQINENKTGLVSPQEISESKLKKIVSSFIGVPYKSGGTTRRGMDCSGFVWRVYTDLGQKDIPRTSSAKLSKMGTAVSQKNIQLGDLVFFKKWGRINHVGIYMGDNNFAHASSKKGVMYTSLDNEYFRNRLVSIRRVK